MSTEPAKTQQPNDTGMERCFNNAQLPCGACEICIEFAVDREVSVIHHYNQEYEDCYVHLKEVAKAFAERFGDAMAVWIVAETLAARLCQPQRECLNSALQLLDYETVPMPDTSQTVVVRLVA